MKLTWAVELASWTVAREARAAAERAPSYRGEFCFGPEDGEAQVFGVFGDSVGCGFGVSQVGNTFAAVVARRLAERRRVLCRIAAVSGARTASLGAQPVAGDERWAAVSIGTNDALHGVPLAEVERDLSEFLSRLRHAERVVVLGPGDLASVALLPDSLRPYVRKHLQSYEEALKAAASRFTNAVHIGFSSVRAPLTPDHFAEDGFHPGDRGHGLIGELVYPPLSETRSAAA